MSQITDPKARAAIRAWIEQQYEEMHRSSYYQLIGVPHDAPEPTIRTSYYHLVARFHPDLYVDPLDPETRQKLVALYSRLVEGYRILSDGAKRVEYDKLLSRGKLRWTQEEEKKPPGQNIDLEIKDANAKRFFKLGRQALMAGNGKAAVMNLKFALSAEPQNALIKSELAKAEALFKSQGG